MAIKVEIFTSPMCPHCPMAEQAGHQTKDKLGDKIDLDIINTMDEEGRKRAIEYNIMGVPSIAINGVIHFVGAPSYEELLAKINEQE